MKIKNYNYKLAAPAVVIDCNGQICRYIHAHAESALAAVNNIACHLWRSDSYAVECDHRGYVYAERIDDTGYISARAALVPSTRALCRKAPQVSLLRFRGKIYVGGNI